MLPVTIQPSPNANALHAQTNGTTPEKEPEQSPESLDAMIHRAKEILAGRITPPELVTPPDIIDWFQQEFGGYDPPPTPEGRQRIIEPLTLQAHFRGEPIAACRIEGRIAVLAVGEQEITALLAALVNAEAPRVVILDTNPY